MRPPPSRSDAEPPSPPAAVCSRAAAFLLPLLLSFWLTSLSACREPEPVDFEITVDTTDTRAKDLPALAAEQKNLTRFVQALEEVGLIEELEAPGPYTIFAPTDAAFARTSFSLDTLLAPEHQDSLRKVVTYHIVRGRFLPNRIRDSLQISTMLNEPLSLKRRAEGSALTVAGHDVLSMVEGRNGVLYVVGSVLNLPPPDTTEALVPTELELPDIQAGQ